MIATIETSPTLSSTTQRDLKSAINRVVGKWLGADIADTPADPAWLREHTSGWTAVQFGVSDAFDPKQNIEAGATFLKQLLDKYKGDIGMALGAYNAGPSTVDQAGGIPNIPETRDYVDAILKKIAEPRPVSQ